MVKDKDTEAGRGKYDIKEEEEVNLSWWWWKEELGHLFPQEMEGMECKIQENQYLVLLPTECQTTEIKSCE